MSVATFFTMDNRNTFLKVFHQIAGPVFKEDGFKGSGQTFRRILGPVVHVFNIQGSRYGGKCCVNLGIHLDFLPALDGTTLFDLTKIEEVACEFRTRLNYGQLDTWWPYGINEIETEESVKAVLQTYRDVGRNYFLRFSRFPEDFTRLTPETFGSWKTDVYPRCWTKVRTVLSLARIYMHLGDSRSAKIFAEKGIELTDKIVFLRHQFSEILEATKV